MGKGSCSLKRGLLVGVGQLLVTEGAVDWGMVAVG